LLLKVGSLKDGDGRRLDLLAKLIGQLFLQVVGRLFSHVASPFRGKVQVRGLGLGEPARIVTMPEEELEILSTTLDVEKIVHEVAKGAGLAHGQL